MQRIGVFDSGVGGLSVWRELTRSLPGIGTVYLADQQHIPYGPQPVAAILDYARGIVQFLENAGCDTVVIACNTASAVALQVLRAEKPHLVFIGMEPAIKPAAERSRSGVVAVLATPTTLEGKLFSDTLRKHAQNRRVMRQPCPGLVEQIERGEINSPATREMLRVFLEQPLLSGADTFVLACTHYAFVRPAIQKLAGSATQVIDPAPAIARRLQALLAEANPPHTSRFSGQHAFYTTGSTTLFDQVASQLLEQPILASALRWNNEASLEMQRNQ